MDILKKLDDSITKVRFLEKDLLKIKQALEEAER